MQVCISLTDFDSAFILTDILTVFTVFYFIIVENKTKIQNVNFKETKTEGNFRFYMIACTRKKFFKIRV